MNGYLRSLDTVNFNVDSEENQHLILKEKTKRTKGSLILYSLFYNINLSPNQLIDLYPLRKLLEDKPEEIANLPLNFFIETEFVNTSNPFEAQLLSYLRRGGENAFIFSSLKNSEFTALDWGDKIGSGYSTLTDREILKLAKRHHDYGKIIDWVQNLDKSLKTSERTIKEFQKKIQYKDIFHNYWITSPPDDRKIDLSKAISRSHAFQLLKSEGYLDKPGMKSLPNFISNIVYSKGALSDLVYDIKEEVPVKGGVEDITKHARFRIDLEQLQKIFPNIFDKLSEIEFKEMAGVYYNTRPAVKKAWMLAFDIKTRKVAEDIMNSVLREFLIDMNFIPRMKDILKSGWIKFAYSSYPKPELSGNIEVGGFLYKFVTEYQLNLHNIIQFDDPTINRTDNSSDDV